MCKLKMSILCCVYTSPRPRHLNTFMRVACYTSQHIQHDKSPQRPTPSNLPSGYITTTYTHTHLLHNPFTTKAGRPAT